MRGKQKNILDTGLLTRLQQTVGATFWRAEQSKCIRDMMRTTLWNSGGIMRCIKFESSLPEPAEIRAAGVGKERLSRLEPATHPPRSHLIVGPEAESDHEHHREVGQRSASPHGPRL